MRTSFRYGVRLGLLAGICFALYLAVKTRRTEPAATQATGVDGRWPEVTPRPGAERTREAGAGTRPSAPSGTTHPPGHPPTHMPVSVPEEASALGAPPAVSTPAATAPEPGADVAPTTPAPTPPAPPAAPTAPAGPAPTIAAPTAKKAAAKKAAAVKSAAKKAVAKKEVAKKAAAQKVAKAAKAVKKAASGPAPATDPWVAPEEGGACPVTHPVKAKVSSRLFHLPGMFAYNRTAADRCYVDEATAVADGFTKAKR